MIGHQPNDQTSFIELQQDLLVGHLFADRIPLYVPIYQRAYAWESEEILDFIKDIKQLYQSVDDDSQSQPIHYFGGIVSIHYHEPNETGHKYEIVDGQQRLSTFMLAFSLLAKALSVISEEAKLKGETNTAQQAANEATNIDIGLIKYGRDSLKQHLRLSLSKADHAFFEQLIIGGNPNPIRESHKRLESAQKLIHKELFAPILTSENNSVIGKLENALRLKKRLVDNCCVVHIIFNDKNKAYHLFSILNDRGKTLTDGDLLRTRTLQLLDKHADLQGQVEGSWDSILSGNPSEIDHFLRSYFPSVVGERAPKLGLFDYFCRHFFNYTQPILSDRTAAVAVEKQVAIMQTESGFFHLMADGQWPYENPIASAWDRDRLYRLIKILKYTQGLPLLLSARQYLNEKIFSDLVNLLERFVFRYINIVGAHPSPLGDKHYYFAKVIRENSSQFKLSHLRDSLRQMAYSDAPNNLFKVQLQSKLDYSQSSQRRLIKHFFTTLEDYYAWWKRGASGNPKPSKDRLFDLNQITIEHIYPQNASSCIASCEDLKHHIGNLSFWAPEDNEKAGNASFNSKKSRYKRSHVLLNQELASCANWTERKIHQRQNQLIEMALKVFAI